ncbi:cyclase family protein [Pseudonocardia yuanmonensis]|uniref:Cyclase family protein n=1 Tax=Pseudonocardia yuanmonensis TaxID=1095914 RepID=A0ABP8XVQ3_9PSEU
MSAADTYPRTTAASSADQWWPSRYGAGDQAGALNEIGPRAVVEAARLVRTGRVYDLAHVLHADMPAFSGRAFTQVLQPDQPPVGRNQVHWVVEEITATQQMGTHLDGLNHLHEGDRAYNGHRLADIRTPYGTDKLGIDTLPQVVTRGLCLDVAAIRGVGRLAPGEVVTVADAEAALASAHLTVRPGDAVLFHTGHGVLWDADPDAYAHGEPGPGHALAQWIADHRIVLTGCDTWSFGPYPPEDPDEPFKVPQILNTRHGVVVAENLRLDALARDRVHEFLLVVAHAKPRGATGAWVAPLAIT